MAKQTKKRKCGLSGGKSENYDNHGEKALINDIYNLTDYSVSKEALRDIINCYWQAVGERVSEGKNVQIFCVGSFRAERRNIKGSLKPTVKFSMSSQFKKQIINDIKNVSNIPVHKPRKDSKDKFKK